MSILQILTGVWRNYLPVGTLADVMHVELDGFGLLFVLEMIISQQVVHLIDDRR